jgi:hypothetical protein
MPERSSGSNRRRHRKRGLDRRLHVTAGAAAADAVSGA